MSLVYNIYYKLLTDMAEKVDGDLEMTIATSQTLSEDNVQCHILLSHKANKIKYIYIGSESVLLTNDICSSSTHNITLLWLQRVSLIT